MLRTELYLVICALASLGALCLSLSAFWRIRQGHRHSSLLKRLRSTELALLSVEDSLDKLQVLAKRKYHRDATRANRAAKREEQEQEPDHAGPPDPQKDPEGWKKYMNAQRALGRI